MTLRELIDVLDHADKVNDVDDIQVACVVLQRPYARYEPEYAPWLYRQMEKGIVRFVDGREIDIGMAGVGRVYDL